MRHLAELIGKTWHVHAKCMSNSRQLDAASAVQAESSGVVWVMERAIFRGIIVVSTMQKRQRYEEALQGMPLFSALMPQQRAAIADCLSLETFQVSSANKQAG